MALPIPLHLAGTWEPAGEGETAGWFHDEIHHLGSGDERRRLRGGSTAVSGSAGVVGSAAVVGSAGVVGSAAVVGQRQPPDVTGQELR